MNCSIIQLRIVSRNIVLTYVLVTRLFHLFRTRILNNILHQTENYHLLVKMIVKFIHTVLIGLACCWIVDGFHTDKCPHDKLATQAKRFITCMHKSLVESTEHLLTDYRNQITANNFVYNATNGCQIFMGSLIEIKECSTTYLGQCFDNHPTKLQNDMFDSLTQICETNFDSDKLEDWAKNFNHKLKNSEIAKLNISEVQTFLADFDKEDVVKNDRNCSEKEWEHSFESGLENKECETTLEQFLVAFYSPQLELDVPTDMSLCTAMANVLGSCVKGNSCVSKREVELFHQLVWMAYQIPMDMLIKVKDTFGNLQHLDEKLDLTTFKFGKTEIAPQDEGSALGKLENLIVLHVIDGFIDDYDTHACRALVSHGLHDLHATTPKPPAAQKTAYNSNAALWLCSITLVIVSYLIATETEVGRRMTGRLTNKIYGNMYASPSTIGTFETSPRSNGIFR